MKQHLRFSCFHEVFSLTDSLISERLKKKKGEPRAVFYRTLIDSMTLTKYFVCLREHLVLWFSCWCKTWDICSLAMIFLENTPVLIFKKIFSTLSLINCYSLIVPWTNNIPSIECFDSCKHHVRVETFLVIGCVTAILCKNNQINKWLHLLKAVS